MMKNCFLFLVSVFIFSVSYGQQPGSIDLSFNTNDVSYGLWDGANNLINKITVKSDAKAIAVFSIEDKLFTSKLKNNDVALSSLTKGIYLIQITADEGRVITKKLVKN
jgi:hypothetical protein